MPENIVNECLSFIDAYFLYVEQPGAPVNVASINVFEGVIPFDACMRYIESKLALLPRFLQRVVTPPFGPPIWQNDPYFDVRNHVHEITLKRGSEAEWKSAASKLLSTHLERSRPLWDITLFHGLKGKRTGVVVRCHHCVVDGVAGVGMLNALLDQSSTAAPPRPKKHRAQAAPQHDPGTVLLDGLISSCFSTAQVLLTAHSELLRMAQQASHSNGKEGQAKPGKENPAGPMSRMAPLGELTRLLSELIQPVDRLPYNVLCRGPQKFEWAEFPMPEITAIRKACDATVNEVVLTVLTSALQRYAERHSLNIEGRKLRIVIPVNVRGDGEAVGTGNRITFLPVDIPLGIRDPRKLLARVQERVRFSRAAHGGDLVAMLWTLLGAIPTSLQMLTGSFLSQLPISLSNSICTNVRGPDTPLYLLGHKLLSTYPYVPIGGEMGMNCAVMSYNGTLFAGFTGDAQAIPDLSRAAGFFKESFAELRDAVGAHVPQKVKRQRKKPRIKTGKSVENFASGGDDTESESAAVAVVA
ncbi:MAG: wax ester/triacylglycerol synthase domain-containing protein [Candidatus Korobacteraceae bacterium]|jgi:diacylglycerol O-acyltransferase